MKNLLVRISQRNARRLVRRQTTIGVVSRSLHSSTTLFEEADAAPSVSEPEVGHEIIWTTNRLSKEQIAKVDSIFHKILWLDAVETGLLTASINFKLGRALSPQQQAAIERQLDVLRMGGSVSSQSDTQATPEEEAPSLFSVQLSGFDEKSKIKVIKEVRAIAGLGLKESKELVESVPTFIQKDLSAEKAEELKSRLEAVGAKVELIS